MHLHGQAFRTQERRGKVSLETNCRRDACRYQPGHYAVNRWDNRDRPRHSSFPGFKACVQPREPAGLHRSIWYRNQKNTKDSAQGSFLSEITWCVSGPGLYSERSLILGNCTVWQWWLELTIAMCNGQMYCFAVKHPSSFLIKEYLPVSMWSFACVVLRAFHDHLPLQKLKTARSRFLPCFAILGCGHWPLCSASWNLGLWILNI